MQLKGRRSWRQYLLSIDSSLHTRQHVQEVIYRNFEHMRIDLPKELEGIVNTLQMIGIQSIALSEKQKDELCKRMVDAMWEKQEANQAKKEENSM